MGCQVEPLILQYEVKCIVLFIFRPLLTDELDHLVDEASYLLDCVGLEMGDVMIRIFIFLEISVLSKLNGIPCDHKVSVIKNTLAEYPFLDPLSNLSSNWMAQEIGDCMNPFRG